VGFQLGFLLLALIWQFDFSPFMVLIIAILNDGECPCTLRITIYNDMDSNVHSRIETLYFVELCILDSVLLVFLVGTFHGPALGGNTSNYGV
jgi:hypothetical protein